MALHHTTGPAINKAGRANGLSEAERNKVVREGELKGNEMTFEPVKSGSNMASCRADQEGHYSIFRRLIWENNPWMLLIYRAEKLKWTTGRVPCS